MVEFGSFKVELACLLSAGLSARAYASIDLQSDKDSARKMCPGYLTGQDNPGGLKYVKLYFCLRGGPNACTCRVFRLPKQ